MELNLLFTKRDYNPETGLAIVRAEDSDTGLYGVGVAKVHPDDLDLHTEITGISIAGNRAILKLMVVLKAQNDAVLKNKVALKILSEEDISTLEEQQKLLQDSIVALDKQIKDYILEKDAAFKKIRENRELYKNGEKKRAFADLGDLTKGMTAEQKQAIAQQIVAAATSETERLVLEGEND